MSHLAAARIDHLIGAKQQNRTDYHIRKFLLSLLDTYANTAGNIHQYACETASLNSFQIFCI
jgi:hypothetical protein